MGALLSEELNVAVNSAARLTCCAADGRTWCHTQATGSRLLLWISLPLQHVNSNCRPCSLLLLKLLLLLLLLLLPLLPSQQTPLFALLSPLFPALSALCNFGLQPQQPRCAPKTGALAPKSSIASQNTIHALKQVLLVQPSAWPPPVIPQQTGLMQQQSL